MTNQIKYFLLCLIFVFGNVIIQISMEQKGLNNEMVNGYSPTSTDAFDYIERAELVVKQGDFVNAFKDGNRVPGYSLFLIIFYYLSDTPLLMARYVQIILSALIILLSYLTLVNILHSYSKAILGSLVVTLWIPFYYFSPILMAESCSIFFFALFIFVLSSLNPTKPTAIIYTLPILLVWLVYLKPNHIILFIPLLAFLLLKIKGLTLRHLVGISMFLTIMLIPWAIFLSVMNNNLILLSTTSGLNLYLGTGVDIDLKEDPNSLMSLTARKLNLRDEQIITQTEQNVKNMTKQEENVYRSAVAKEIWLSRPINTLVYSLSKVFHGFGFSLRDSRDLLLVILFISSVVFSLYLWISRNHREWCLFFWAILLVISFQMFIYLPNQRFKTVIFDLPAIMIAIIGMFQFLDYSFKIVSASKFWPAKWKP